MTRHVPRNGHNVVHCRVHLLSDPHTLEPHCAHHGNKPTDGASDSQVHQHKAVGHRNTGTPSSGQVERNKEAKQSQWAVEVLRPSLPQIHDLLRRRDPDQGGHFIVLLPIQVTDRGPVRHLLASVAHHPFNSLANSESLTNIQGAARVPPDSISIARIPRANQWEPGLPVEQLFDGVEPAAIRVVVGAAGISDIVKQRLYHLLARLPPLFHNGSPLGRIRGSLPAQLRAVHRPIQAGLRREQVERQRPLLPARPVRGQELGPRPGAGRGHDVVKLVGLVGDVADVVGDAVPGVLRAGGVDCDRL
mmetsp:Transcript_114057/g.261736  ORF Transcript_114057/g.261736 Transcript_114057/m.261736 type:complete len:304 (-) Transcript_114057:320-1231(-)